MKKTILVLLVLAALVLAAVSLYARTTIWACSNHNPVHTAISTRQMQKMTKLYGCTGWHILK